MSSKCTKFDQEYFVEEDSDLEDGGAQYCSSSDDDLERSLTRDYGSMENELNRVKEFSDSESKGTSAGKNPSKGGKGNRIDKFLDSDLFDDDCDMEDEEKLKFPRPSNDELLYDPGMDDRDQRWVDRQRTRYVTRKDNRKDVPLTRSDAILSCPACMSTVCIDCQRHEVYRHQYRAMFVMNVEIIMNEVLRYEVRRSKSKKKRRGPITGGSLIREEDSELCSTTVGDDERYHPVKCKECRTEVAVYDKEEVYHFFNVLASQA